MENNLDYMTIQQFAELVGTSKQNIYNQTKGRLEKYTVIVNGRLHILKAAADDYYSEQPQPIPLNSEQSILSSENNPKQPNENQSQFETIKQNQPNSSGLNSENSAENSISDIIELLKQELAAKDEQLAAKDEQLAAKDKQIDELHTLLSQQQQLQLASQLQYQTLLEEKKQQEEQQSKDKEQVTEPQKKGLFGIFKKK